MWRAVSTATDRLGIQLTPKASLLESDAANKTVARVADRKQFKGVFMTILEAEDNLTVIKL